MDVSSIVSPYNFPSSPLLLVNIAPTSMKKKQNKTNLFSALCSTSNIKHTHTHTMAKKSQKSRAQRNISTLNTLHLSSLGFNLLFLTWNFLPFTKSRSLLAYTILSIPAFIAEFVIERSGRPVVVNGALKSSGEDLAAEGLTEYLFDIVWVTWGCLVAVLVLGNWGWLLWVSIFFMWYDQEVLLI